MQPAEFPQRSCREGVHTSAGSVYSCELVALHPGPCASLSSPDLVFARDKWEAEHPDWKTQIGNHDTIV